MWFFVTLCGNIVAWVQIDIGSIAIILSLTPKEAFKISMQLGIARMLLMRNWMHRECGFSFHVQEYRKTPKRKSFPDAKKTLTLFHPGNT